jgi:hypothetical protein
MSNGKTNKSAMKLFRLALLVALMAVVAHPSVAQVLGPVDPALGGNDFAASGSDTIKSLETFSYTNFNSGADSQLLEWETSTDLDGWSFGVFYKDPWVGFYDPDHDGDHDPTPEPASFLLMGIGLLVIGVLLRRRSIRT